MEAIATKEALAKQIKVVIPATMMTMLDDRNRDKVTTRKDREEED